MAFRLMAHRGASVDAVDNSAEAFGLAIVRGADLIETDVRKTADDVLIIEHDAEIAGARVSQTSLGDLRKLKPTLLTVNEVLERFGNRIAFCWEIKGYGLEPKLIKQIKTSIPASIWEETEFSSFDFDTAVNCQQLAPANKVGWLTETWDGAAIKKARAANLSQICPPAKLIFASPELMGQAILQGIVVRAWLVQKPEEVTKLDELGVYGATVNFPGEARAYLSYRKPTDDRIIYQDDLIFIFVPKQAHISRNDGGHLVVEPLKPYTGIEDCSRELRHRLIDAVTAASAAVLSLPQMIGGIANIQDMGNWFNRDSKYRSPKRLHFHIYGRALEAVGQPFGEALSFPPYEQRHSLKLDAFNAAEQKQLSREIALRMENYIRP